MTKFALALAAAFVASAAARAPIGQLRCAGLACTLVLFAPHPDGRPVKAGAPNGRAQAPKK